MEDKKKRTQRKSKGLRSKYIDQQAEAAQAEASVSEEGSGQSASENGTSRVVDMSWAAEYLNDDWENKHTAKGAYDTKSPAPSPETAEKTEKETAVDNLSETRKFKAVDAIPEEEDTDDLVKIRDAETDKTIVSVDEAEKVRAAANALTVDEDLDDIVKIRDAATDKTIVSVEEAAGVRAAAAALDVDEGLDDMVKIRDAATDRTIVSVTEASQVRDAASALDAGTDDGFEDLNNLRDAATLMRSDEPEIYFPEKKKAKSEPEPVPEPVIEPEAFIKPDNDDLGSTRVIENIIDPGESRESRPAKKKSRSSGADSSRKKKAAASRSREREDRYDDRDDYYDDRDYDRDRYRRNDRYDRYDRYDDRNYDRENVRYIYEPVKSPLRFIPLVLVIALCVLGFIAAKEVCYDVPINAADYSRYSYTVEKGLTDAQLAQDLKAMGLIDNPLIFRLRAILYSAKYVEGTYELSPCYSTEKMINILSGYEYVTE